MKMSKFEILTSAMDRIGFSKVDSRSTKFDVYVGDTKKLYESSIVEERFVFISKSGRSVRVGKSKNVTDLNIPLFEKTKARLVRIGEAK